MKILICSASNDAINKKYKDEAHRVTSFLAEEGCELIWGSGRKSIMGICYEEFAKRDCKIWGYTTEKYTEEIISLPKAHHKICKNTFDLKKEMFNEADMILILAGGTGTVSELFTFLEEVRSNDADKILIVYNESHHFDKCWEVINDLISRNFNEQSIYDYLHIANSIEEFKMIYNDLTKKRKDN